MSREREPVAVFVYGTLQSGEENHHLLASARFIGAARTPPRYRLVDLGGYPGMLEGGHTAVLGELYEVDAATLAQLDALERHPDWYRRTIIALDGGHQAQAYILPTRFGADGQIIEDGNWVARRAADKRPIS